MNKSRSGKTAAQPISIDGSSQACTRACSKAEQRKSEGEWEALNSFDKNKQTNILYIKETGRKEQRKNVLGQKAKPSPPPTQAIDVHMGEREKNTKQKEEQ